MSDSEFVDPVSGEAVNPYAPPRGRTDLIDAIQRRQERDSSAHAEGLSGPRLLAYVIDSFIMGGVGFGLFFVLAMAEEAGVVPRDMAEVFEALVSVLYLGAGALYGTVLESSSMEATLGKRIMGLRVERTHGAPAGLGAAIGRNLAKYLMLAMCWILGATVLSREGALWDRMAGTRVVRQ